MDKVLLAMSGGVDSSVAAYLLLEQGYEVIGATMRLRDEMVLSGKWTCCAPEDTEDAKDVCRRLGIPHETLNYMGQFRDTVMDPFVRDYENGRTPNPCIRCNQYLKFGTMLARAEELGCRYLATGHYIRRIQNTNTGLYELHCAKDRKKDQSYVLYFLSQQQLAHSLFPLGEYEKPQIREIAERLGFANARKHDSQDICFIPDRDYAGFIERYTGQKPMPGEIRNESGEILGRHKGIIHYTVGQRKGLGLALDEPAYVREICPEDNSLIVGKDPYAADVIAEDVSWVSGSPPENPEVQARARYHQIEKPAEVTSVSEKAVRVHYYEPQRALTPGQAIVFYSGDRMLGGGTIQKVLR